MRAVLKDHAEGGGALHFRYDPEAIVSLKSCGWRWDPERKFWWGRPHVVDDGVEALELLGYSVVDERAGAQAPPPAPRPAQIVDRTTYYERLIAKAPAEEQQAAYRRLMAAFHPDRYGDEEEAKAINAAWDRLRGRNRRGA